MSLGTASEQWGARRNVECAELLAVMQEQEVICRRLLELSQGERVALADGRIDDLEKATAEKAGLVERMELLESKRRGLALGVARQLGLSGETSLLGLATRLDPEDADHLLRVRTRVADTVASLRESNENNLVVMRKSLDLVRESMRQIRRAVGAGDGYTSDGKASLNIRGNIVVDCKA